MTERRVRFTPTAQRHVHRERAWWLENRDYPNLFATDLEAALRVVAILPGIGTSYEQAGIVGLRRLYLRKVDCHLYYTFDDWREITSKLETQYLLRSPAMKERLLAALSREGGYSLDEVLGELGISDSS